MYRVWFDSAKHCDMYNEKNVELAHILLVLGPRVVSLKWELRLVESVNYPEGTVPLEDRDVDLVFSTLELMHHITPLVQIIDGEARGFDRDGNLVLVIIGADEVWRFATEYARIVELLRAEYPSLDLDE